MNNRILLLGLILLSTFIISTSEAQTLAGSKERIKIYSPSIEGNLVGDSPDRDVSVYLPPGYVTNPDKRYPVIYMLHGFTDDDSKWFGWEDHWINLPEIIDSTIKGSGSREMIVVMPNAYNTFKGSIYSSSVTIGDWETFITSELVDYIDQNYRTIPDPSSRGLAGHSMGGYGAIRLAMKYPGVFSCIFSLSPCCLEYNPPDNAGLMRNAEAVKELKDIPEQPFFVSATLATAAAWAPNPDKPPLYLDLPFKDGQILPEIVSKHEENAPLEVLDRFTENLEKLNAIGLDVGTRDFGIFPSTKQIHEALTDHNIAHYYESYDGGHIDRIAERIQTKMLPFFSKHLSFEY
jgi:enterochelin esterase-like enzyme